MGKATQAERIIEYMREHPEGITALQALNDLQCLRLAARIHDLRAEGFQISEEAHTTGTGKRVSRYRLTGIAQTPRIAQDKDQVKESQPITQTIKIRAWVCAQCGSPASYAGSSAGESKYGIGKCLTHGRTAVMVIHGDAS
jgi:hypothetical protein